MGLDGCEIGGGTYLSEGSESHLIKSGFTKVFKVITAHISLEVPINTEVSNSSAHLMLVACGWADLCASRSAVSNLAAPNVVVENLWAELTESRTWWI